MEITTLSCNLKKLKIYTKTKSQLQIYKFTNHMQKLIWMYTAAEIDLDDGLDLEADSSSRFKSSWVKIKPQNARAVDRNKLLTVGTKIDANFHHFELSAHYIFYLTNLSK